MNTKNLYKEYDKLTKIINSCKTVYHLKAAERCLELFRVKYKDLYLPYYTNSFVSSQKKSNTQLVSSMYDSIKSSFHDKQTEIWSNERKNKKYKANFLWPHEEGSIVQLGYEFANAKTEEYREEVWKEIVSIAKQLTFFNI